MKSAKGFLSLLLALVMVLSVASVSFAESAVTLTYADCTTEATIRKMIPYK